MCTCLNFAQVLVLCVILLMPATFLISYGIAVGKHHVEPTFPYISDTGATPPESSIFGQFLNISAAMLAAVAIIRYLQLEQLIPSYQRANVIQNKVGVFLACMAALGMSMVGNFQETNELIVHIIGANFAFGLGTVYFCIQTSLTYGVHCVRARACVLAHIRLLVCFFCVTFFCMVFSFEAVAKKQYHGQNPRKWFPEDGGFSLHVVSTASEWALAGCFLAYLSTFLYEFKNIELTGPTVIIKQQTVVLSPSGYESLESDPLLA